jgi:hypothetical protein
MATRAYEVRIERTVVFRRTYRVRASSEARAHVAAILADEIAGLDNGDLFHVHRSGVVARRAVVPPLRHPAKKDTP